MLFLVQKTFQMKIITRTTRLLIREMTPEDADNAFLLNNDPEVIRYTGDVAFESPEEARQFLENYDHFRKYGFGRWALELLDSGEFIGWCGLKYTPELDEYDLGYRLLRKHWSKGYASEAGRSCLELGFGEFEMPRIVGRVMPENTASLRVLEKLGFHFFESRLDKGKEIHVFELFREEFD